uniref:hypothetical protein n=1 Tax=Altererythrobacter segetis TaxID=1104773 RepID=UPI001407DD99|nr:hypothetical protein [Altererythrobacter segetis]
MAIFSSAHLKLKRARQHITELEVLLDTHLRENPITSEFVPGTGGGPEGWSPTTKITVPPAPELAPAIVGDIIHNARTALDHMASEMARLNNQPDRGVYFPFAENAAGLEEQIKKKNFKRCGAAAVALLRTFKPYKGGNIELRAVHDLDVLDKHRALVPVAGVKPRAAKAFEWVGPMIEKRRQLRWIPIELVDPQWVFGKDDPLGDRPVIETLKELVDLCEGILEAFAALKTDD